MTELVIDASVAAKWFLPETDEPLLFQAVNLVDLYERDELQFVVPDLFYVEVSSAIWKAVRRGRASRAFGDQAIQLLVQRKFATVPSLGLLEKAFQIAADYQQSVYDALYVALALKAQTELITADERLANALAARFPVKWLGAI